MVFQVFMIVMTRHIQRKKKSTHQSKYVLSSDVLQL